MSILKYAAFVKEAAKYWFGEDQERFKRALGCWWNVENNQFQLWFDFKGKRYALSPCLPSYPNPASSIGLTALRNIPKLGHPNISHLLGSIIKNFEIDGQQVGNPQEFDIAVAKQLSFVFSEKPISIFQMMSHQERFGVSEEYFLNEGLQARYGETYIEH